MSKINGITVGTPMNPARFGGNNPITKENIENALGYTPADEEQIPENTSDLKNDSGYITIAVATLINYYLKTETYTKGETYSRTEVDGFIAGLDRRLSAIADSDDTTLDQLSEIVAYIKANKSLIDSITTSKVNVADIVDNLTTGDGKKPLSAAQGKTLKELYDALPAWAKETNKPTYNKTDVGLGNVDNVRQYSADNPPPYPVTSINGKTGAVALGAGDVGARPSTWMPTAAEVGADASGTADSRVGEHNVSEDAHNDIRLLISGLSSQLNALANSTDEDLDQLAEIVEYIKANKTLIDSITTSKVSVADIIDNLTTSVSNKPLSAKMGVELKKLIDAIKIPTTLPASDVYSWAKQPKKPTYTAEEVGAASKDQVTSLSEAIADQQTEINGKQPKGNYALSSELSAETTAREQAVADINARLGQQNLLIAEGETMEDALAWLETNGDRTKAYLLPDDFFYTYRETTEVGGVAYENKLLASTDTDRTTIFNGTGYKTGVRLSGSSGNESSSAKATYGISGFISAKAGDMLRVKNFLPADGVACYVIAYNSSNAATGNIQNPKWTSETGGYESPGYGEVTLDETTFGSGFNAVRLCLNGLDGNTIVTINQEINEGGGTVIVEKWASTGHSLVSSDYGKEIANLKNITDSHTKEINELKNGGVVTANSGTMYIAPDGDDSNNGLSTDNPKKTVAACVSAGATRISAKRGVYAEKIYLTDIGELEIFPTDNAQDYTNNGNWEPIVFDVSDTVAVSGFAAYNSIKRVAYSNAKNEQFDKVFTKQSQPPIIGDGYGSRYNSTVWLLSADEKTVCIKLKPVLTVAECESETNTFSYVDGYIYINADWTDVENVVVPTNWGSGVSIVGAQRVVLREVEVRFSGAYNLEIKNCAYIDLYKCFAKYTSYASGFHPVNVNGVFNSCYATKNYDGFGVNGCGHTTYIDCISEFNFDDGVSHHAESEGTFIGGRYEGNGKGGNTPAYGAKVNIYGGIYKDNASFGIGYLYASQSGKADGTVQGAVMVGNPVGLAVNANCTVTAIDCKYSGNTADKEIKGNFVEY